MRDADELASIHAEFADPITYTGAGLDGDAIPAVYCEEAAPTFTGNGATLRKASFEIQITDLPGTPRNGDIIVHETGEWSVINPTRSRIANAWILDVEEAS